MTGSEGVTLAPGEQPHCRHRGRSSSGWGHRGFLGLRIPFSQQSPRAPERAPRSQTELWDTAQPGLPGMIVKMFFKCTAVPKSELSPQLGSLGDSAPPADLARLALAAITGSELTNKGVRSCQYLTLTGKTAAASSATAELNQLFSLVFSEPPQGFCPASYTSQNPWARNYCAMDIAGAAEQNTAKSTNPKSLKRSNLEPEPGRWQSQRCPGLAKQEPPLCHPLSSVETQHIRASTLL